jgi:hypothetical protein
MKDKKKHKNTAALLDLMLALRRLGFAHVAWRDVKEADAGKVLLTFECPNALLALELVRHVLEVRALTRETKGG